MITEAERGEYLVEIRKQVCSRCVERPPGGPPCAPRGKPCGIEMHLPQLLDAVRSVQSGSIEPYLRRNQKRVCLHRALLNSDVCPCPMHYLAALLVEAVEAVDERRGGQ
jgi:hypothetical protein